MGVVGRKIYLVGVVGGVLRSVWIGYGRDHGYLRRSQPDAGAFAHKCLALDQSGAVWRVPEILVDGGTEQSSPGAIRLDQCGHRGPGGCHVPAIGGNEGAGPNAGIGLGFLIILMLISAFLVCRDATE